MNITLERAFGAATGATIVILSGWGVAWIVGLRDPALPIGVTLALLVASVIWFAFAHDYAAASFSECLADSLQKPSIHRAFALLSGMFFIWIVARLLADWSIEPDITNYGSCFDFSEGLCGEVDRNADRRDRLARFVNNLGATLILFSPLLLFVGPIRTRFS